MVKIGYVVRHKNRGTFLRFTEAKFYKKATLTKSVFDAKVYETIESSEYGIVEYYHQHKNKKLSFYDFEILQIELNAKLSAC